MAKELTLRKTVFKNQRVNTIYFGGGTPSLLSNQELQYLLEAVYSNYSVSKNPEITLEANPDDLTDQRISQLANTPINRLSIGVQSFFNDDLQRMNRAHNAHEAQQCLEQATRYFNNITIDLIYGIPNMSLERWNQNLQIAFGFKVNHISAYALTVEPKTALANFIKKGQYPPVNDTLALQHFDHLIAETRKQGFVQYEISNFGKPQFFSKHNTSYWQGKPYLGIGPSAHSFYGDQRSWNVSNNTKYLKQLQDNSLPCTVETLTVADRFNESVMTGLRTVWGVSVTAVKKEFGDTYVAYLLKQAQPYINKGQLTLSNDCLVTTDNGKFLADGIAAALFYVA